MPTLDSDGQKGPDDADESISRLTALQRDVLWIVHNDQATTRSEIQKVVSAYRDHDYSRGHIHRTTADLENARLISIDAETGVGSVVDLTEAGKRALQRRRAWTAGQTEAVSP